MMQVFTDITTNILIENVRREFPTHIVLLISTAHYCCSLIDLELTIVGMLPFSARKRVNENENVDFNADLDMFTNTSIVP